MTIQGGDIAVVGMAGRFPGAMSVSEFWENICAKKDSIRSLTDEELRSAGVSERDIADGAYVKAAALLDDVDRFDPGFFKISPLEAELMDPQIRLLLQCAWETLEDAGYARQEAQNIGVFAGAGGVTTSYFANFVNVNDRFEKITAGSTHIGNDKDFLATYISYRLNLTGPSVTVQTACSTSLVALHQARLSLLSGECDMALAGGVTVRVPHVQGYHYKEGYIFSRSGRIRTFDEGADGVVFGSGLGLVLIKRLADAIADGDPIYAVIKGSAIGNDGKGKMSYAASSAKGQIACVRAALKNAGIDAGSIGFVEAHGTGTAMGDPEEVKALSAAFKEQTDKKRYCALGAVKTNVGHLEAAAGIVAFIKAVLAVKHGVIPPTAHYRKPNPRIKFDHTPFYVNTELQHWNDGNTPRRAAVNSLGVGGTNAFVVLENYVPEQALAKQPPAKHRPVVVPLSARSESSLRAYAQKLAEFLAAAVDCKDRIDLADLAYTLQTGRTAMDCRVAFVASSVDELKRGLGRYLEGQQIALPQSGAGTLAGSWAAGEDVDWTTFYADARPRRISLPTYAFAKERYWVENTSVAAAVLHPLLHANTSDLNEQKYSSTFTGDEFFLKDHRVRTKQCADGGSALQKVLPGVAYLEMVRAAIEQAAPIHRDAGVLELRDIVWLQPITVAAETRVHIALVARDPAGQPNPRIDFEVYTQDDQIHCQGQCQFSAESSRERFDIAPLKASMRHGACSAEAIYLAFAKMGLDYGPAHRAITGIDRGERELIARMMLPNEVQATQPPYLLHPSLMDGALQAATALLFDPDSAPRQPIVPFAIESVRILAPCTGEMVAWARYADGSRSDDQSVRLNIDLLDADGNLCVRIRGFTPRSRGRETLGSLLATPVWQLNEAATAQAAYAEPHVVLYGLPQIDVAKIARDCALLQGESHDDIAARYTDLAFACFEKLQTLIRSKPQGKTLVQIALPNTEENAVCAGLSGLLKTATLENPQIAGQIVLVDTGIDTDELAALLHAERGHPHDTLIKYEHGVRHTESWRLLPDDGPGALTADSLFKDGGVYLITGGLGGLGVLFANEILAHTANATIVLTGRTSLSEVKKSAHKKALLEALQAGGRSVIYRQLDLEAPKRVEALIASLRKQYRQLNGIIHSAGMMADGFILKKSADEFRRVLAPKVAGTLHLDRATRDVDLDFLILFSSLSSAVGNLGQADYAAANGFLDEFAGYRNRQVAAGKRRGATLAIRWPLWADGGMQPDAAGRDRLHETTGIYPMDTATGLRMFYRSLALGHDQTLVMEGDLQAMQRTLGGGAALHTAAALPEAPTFEAAAEAPGDLAERTEAFLCKQLAALLKLPAHKVDARAPLENYGIDSILALDLTRLLEQTFGVLPKTLFFEYLTIRELAAYFVKAHATTLSALFSSAPGSPAKQPDTAPSPSEPIASIRCRRRRFAEEHPPTHAATDAIAIVGLSGRYPEARNLQAFWRNLRDGKDCIVEVPKDRWDWQDYYSEDRTEKGCHYSKWGGFIEGVDEFDARFFNISPAEAETIDPQERLFLQHAWMAIEDAGYTRASLQIPNGDDLPAPVGVYAGVMYSEYQLFGAEASLQGKRMGFASNIASIANRVSYALNLHGPSMAVDTMCSSSLTTIHLACQDLKLGRTTLAIAGGVNVTLHPNKYLMLSAGQFISGDGHCQSFGEGGDGYIPGEGVGVVVLKRLVDAERDGNQIYGVIRGSALSHGGKTNGYTVPNPQAQASAIRQALAEAGVDPRHISYLEAHGTGTKLGDPIEIAALTKVFQESTRDTGFCLIGSAKSNIGHAEAAAGIAGLTKVLLQMKYGMIVPSLHSSRLNPHIDFDSTPFVVNQTLRAWQPPVVNGRRRPRIAGISSFGAGGSNAHLIVEEYRPPVAAAPPVADVEHIVPLSTRTAEQLRQKARDLLDFVRGATEPPALASVAYTLQIGREAMDERLAVLADSVATLTERLQAYLDDYAVDGVYLGQVKANQDALSLLTQDSDLQATVGKWIAERKQSKLAELWAKGLALDWASLHAARPALISLPTYPFARQRFWIETAAAARRSPKALATAALHPLLHCNTSDFDQQSYTATFAGDEFFLVGEAGRRCLTEAACLEMARAAIELSLPAPKGSCVLELRDVAWAQPGVAGRPVTIALFDRADEQVAFEIYSTEGDAEIVHCQGRATRSDQPSPPRLDLVAIAAQGGELLTELSLTAALEDGRNDYVLHPALVHSALQAASSLTSGWPHPLAMASLRLFPGANAKFAWVRQATSAERTIDIDLSDEHGHVCVQMRGVRYSAVNGVMAMPMASAQTEAPVALTDSDSVKPAAEPTRVCFDAVPPIGLDLPIPEKPKRRIALQAPGASPVVTSEASLSRKPLVSLATVAPTRPMQAPRAASSVALFDHGNGVFSICIDAPAIGNALSAKVIEDLLRAMRMVADAPAAKVLTIEGNDDRFLSGGLDQYREALAANLYRAIVEFPYPVIAVVRGGASGAGFLVAAVSDFMVCSDSARYVVPEFGLNPSVAEDLLIERFGRLHATDFLYLTAGATGAELKAKGWTCPILPGDQVAVYAQELAANLANKSQTSLRLLKQHLARRIAGAVQVLPAVDGSPLATDETKPEAIPAPSDRLHLQVYGERILLVTIRAQTDASRANELLADLQTVFARIDEASGYRCVVLASELTQFLPEVAEAARSEVAQGFRNTLLGFSRPIVSALSGDATGIAWYVAQFCDACVHSEQGRYSSAEILRDPALAGDAAAVFSLRFGGEAGKRLLLAGAEASGAELRRDYGALHVVGADAVLARALTLADALAAFPTPVLSAWKQRTASVLQAEVAGLGDEGLAEEGAREAVAAAPLAVALESSVISALAHPEGILEVHMADQEAKNQFSEAFSRGMREVFAHVEESGAYKVVVLTGYDNYFASGGTQDTLLAIHQGKARFTDNTVFQLPLRCSVPVIAAMQGHGIGAGWALGMYADLALFSDESRYVSPYMGYGFTPGAGSTLIFPEQIGYDLARETLLTAREYSGGELKERGLCHPVLPRDRVLPAALVLARRIARAPRGRLVALKRRWAEALQALLQDTFERELAMHERTFVGQADTLARLQGRFATPATPTGSPAPPASPLGVEDLGAITASLRKMLAHELRMPEAEIGDGEQFVDLGLDSITGVTWIRRINEQYGTSIEAIKVYSYPTLTQLSRYVHEEAGKAGTRVAGPEVQLPVAPVEAPAVYTTALTSWRNRRRSKAAGAAAAALAQPIAVIGMAGQFPKARNLEEFWQNIAQGRDCIEEVPKHRWDIDRYYQEGEVAPGKTYSRWMGALDEYDRFDAAFFNISPREARSMDPQQRLFLQACWHSIEHAGYNPKALAGSRCGVFVGCSAGDYHQLSRCEQLSGQGFTGAAPAILASRISYFLDLQGPSLSIDTACSSSLVAIATACDSLVSGGSDIVLAGGVNVMAGPAMQIMTAQLRMLSPQGRCFTFDERADGIANGEGVGVVMLKRLADAERDGDCIYGVIEGWSVNQDGRTNGITAPNADSQTRLQQEVYDRFGIDPAGIQLIEAHGTGTALGDPIEVAGLKASFAKYTRNTGYCALGSVKSNIGHCLTAAGVSGFLKILLTLQHAQLPPTIHFRKLNQHISLQDSPFYVNDRLREWQRNGSAPRRAAINAFSFGGTNAHLVVAEYLGRPEPAARSAPAIVPLSARTADQLQRQAQALLAFLRQGNAATLDLSRIAYTLQVGREPLKERAAFIASTIAELEDRLQAFVDSKEDDGGARAEHVYRGQVSGTDSLLALSSDPDFQTMIAQWIGRKALPRLADLWVKGLALDWNAFHADTPAPRRIGLPVYPFAKERYWIEAESGAASSGSGPRHGVVHPCPVAAEVMPIAGPPAAPSVLAQAIRPEKVDSQAPIPLQQLQNELKTSLAEALFMKPSEVDVNKSFTELGLDSIVGVEWVKAINKQYGTAISATRVYDYPSVKELAAFLIGELPVAELAQTAPPAAPAAVAGRSAGSSRLDRIRFEPKYTKHFKELYFYSVDCEGDFQTDGEFSVQCAINPDANVCLKEHVVFGEHLLPTDAYVELVYSAYRTWFSVENVRLKNIAIVNPLLGVKGRDTHIKIVFRRAGDELQFFVKSSLSPEFRDDTLNMQGFIALAEGVPASRFDDRFAIVSRLDSADIPTNTGRYYAPLQRLRFGESAALGLIRVTEHDFRFLTNPFALYGGLCTVINYGAYLTGRHFGASDDQFLPYRIGQIVLLAPLNDPEYRCYAEVLKLEPDSVELYFELVDRAGNPVLVVDSISLRRVASQTLRQQASAAKRRPEVGGTRAMTGTGAAAEKVAIIGMSCRLPMSENIEAFWENLKAGRDCVTEVPADRWGAYADWYHPDPRHPHTSYSKWGGFLDGIDTFDALFFGISPAEAELIDPQQRIFIEECWKTIESAGYAPSVLSNRPCGVYVGCATGDYTRVLAGDGQDTAGAAFMGTSTAILAARISYFLNLKGPALAVDTACSSSLVAVHLACESIRSGENELALAGGINLLVTPIGHILTSQVGMPSRDGRCAPFDASANGIVFSEGCGVLLLKALSAAQRDGDDILGVIQGSGTNQDGKTNGITAPSSNAQQQLLGQVYKKFGIDPQRIGYVEAHGTATALGDPIEVNALSSVFDAYTTDRHTCALGSVKSNIGHTGFAAGVAGIIKVLLCIKHRKLVPSIHYAQPNPHIDFESSPFYINTQYRDWECGQPRLATVSAFGFSGTNAHVVIEEYVPASEPLPAGAPTDDKVLVPLSAKTAEQLQQKARDLLAFIRTHEQPVDLARMAYTLQVGRDAMDHRLAVIAGSVDPLAGALQAWLDDKARSDGVYHSQASRSDDTLAAFFADVEMRHVIDRWVAQQNLPKVADLWVRGFELDWNLLHQGTRPRRMTLPTYPFARERCWVAAGSRKPVVAGRAPAVLHPLLHRNTSDLSQQSYASTFAGEEFFLTDHRVNGQRVLPAVAYLEMARAALVDALPTDQASVVLELRHVGWAQPIVVTQARRVAIAVFPEDDQQFGFEVYSDDGDGGEVVHCQGSGVIGDRPAAQRLDLARLRSQLSRDSLEGAVLYSMFATLGLHYGPAFQGIVAVHPGDDQLLVELSLPDAAPRGGDYLLHPSLMDSALQGSIALIDDLVCASGKPPLPFALESLRVFAACTEQMVAWVRYAQDGRGAASSVIKVDIDLCDTDGTVCVQMRGFSSRSLQDIASFDEAHYQSIIAGVLSNEISADEAVELG